MLKNNIRIYLFLLLTLFLQKNSFIFCNEKHSEKTFPVPYSFLTQKTFKDQYNLDFLTLQEKYKEKDLEDGLIKHIKDFLLKLGKGFALFGRQYDIKVGIIDLLFYHTKLKCFIVVELKRGKFQPKDAGQLNLYISAVDDRLKGDDDNPTMGLLICEAKNWLKVKYALRDINKPMRVAKYIGIKYKKRVPKKFKNDLPNSGEMNSEVRKLRKLQKAKKKKNKRKNTREGDCKVNCVNSTFKTLHYFSAFLDKE